MLDFFKKLLPNFDKRRLIHQHDSVVQTLNEVIKPTLAAYTDIRTAEKEFLHQSAIAQKFVKDAQRRLQRNLMSGELREYETILTGVVTRLETKIELLRKVIDTVFASQVSSTGLTFKQVEIIRLLDLMAFFNSYASKLNHVVLVEHSNKAIKDVDSPFTPAELKWLNANLNTFLELCSIFSMKDVEFKTIIDKTSELEIAEAGDNLTILGTNADPFRLGFVPVLGSIILTVRDAWLVYEVKKYDAAKLRLQSIQLQLQVLKQRQQANPEDGALARQIEYYNNRIRGLELEIHKFEEKAGVV